MNGYKSLYSLESKAQLSHRPPYLSDSPLPLERPQRLNTTSSLINTPLALCACFNPQSPNPQSPLTDKQDRNTACTKYNCINYVAHHRERRDPAKAKKCPPPWPSSPSILRIKQGPVAHITYNLTKITPPGDF